jgi:Calcineurin-like phosphoesterase
MSKGKRHFIIPDTQCGPGHPVAHMEWVGKAIAKYKPDVVVHLGDHWDFPSLSKWSAPGSLDKEGARYIKDVEAGNEALRILENAMGNFRPKRKIILRGNHEHRLQRAVAADPRLDGFMGYHNLNDRALGWEVVDYFNGSPRAIVVDGVTYAHYFSNPNTGNPIGGTAHYKLNAIGTPYVQGHVQGYDIGSKQFATGRVIRGIVAGSCYLHDEPYKGMANSHWRGVVVLNAVRDGDFSEMPLDMNYLCEEYEGMSLARFLQRNYKRAKERFSLANA